MHACQDPPRLAEISKRVEMPASTVLRMVNTLVEQAYGGGLFGVETIFGQTARLFCFASSFSKPLFIPARI